MITKLTPEKLTNRCDGFILSTKAPCLTINEYTFGSFYLGSMNTGIAKIGSLWMLSKSVRSTLTVINPGAVSILSSSKVGNDVTVTLAHDGAAITTSESDLKTELESLDTFNISLMSDGSALASAHALVSIPYDSGSSTGKDAIAMPDPCPTCNGKTTFFRDWTVIPPTFKGYKQKQAINFIGKELKRLGYVHPACKTFYAAEVGDPPTILSDYPPGDGTL